MTDRPRSRLLQGIRLYWVLASASVRAKMQYKFDFVTSAAVQAFMGMYDYVIVAVILLKFRTIQGWDIWEVGLLYSIAKIGWGVYRVTCEELDRFEGYIVRGDFDSVLIRPWPSLFVLLSRNLELTHLSWVLNGTVVAAFSVPHLLEAATLTWAEVVILLVSVLCTVGLYIAVSLATSSAAFRIVRIEELQVFTQNASGTAVLYPLEIYPAWLRYILLSVLPVGVGNYIPVRYVLGKGGTWLNLALPPVVTVVSLCIALRLWKVGETRYHSTGS